MPPAGGWPRAHTRVGRWCRWCGVAGPWGRSQSRNHHLNRSTPLHHDQESQESQDPAAREARRVYIRRPASSYLIDQRPARRGGGGVNRCRRRQCGRDASRAPRLHCARADGRSAAREAGAAMSREPSTPSSSEARLSLLALAVLGPQGPARRSGPRSYRRTPATRQNRAAARAGLLSRLPPSYSIACIDSPGDSDCELWGGRPQGPAGSSHREGARRVAPPAGRASRGLLPPRTRV